MGQSQDFTALCLIERLGGSGGGAQYHVRRLERTKGTPYPAVVARTKNIMQKLPGIKLICDGTGVGRPVLDMFDQAGLRPIGIFIHGGDAVTSDGYGPHGEAPRRFRVPKRDLVATLQVLLQNHRLKIAPVPLSDILASEMLNFKIKIDPVTAHDSYSSWREQGHDDLTLAVCLACWWSENRPRPPIVPENIFAYTRG